MGSIQEQRRGGEVPQQSNLLVIDNPFAQVALTRLRDRTTQYYDFRHHANKLCGILMAESMRGVTLEQITVTTPIQEAVGYTDANDVVIVPVLRAGLAMMHAAMEFFPRSRIGFAGLARDEKTAVASEYYWKVPDIAALTTVVVTDPMLATGGSAVHVLERIHSSKPKDIRLVSVIAAPEGIKTVHDRFPDVHITTAAVDEGLNDRKFIVPGLGDFGDRYFGTEE